VTTAASPPDKAPTVIVSQGSRSRPRSCWATFKKADGDKDDSQHNNIFNTFIQAYHSAMSFTPKKMKLKNYLNLGIFRNMILDKGVVIVVEEFLEKSG
jgi:hypothetical protein